MKPTFLQTALNKDSTNIQFVFVGLSYHPHLRTAVSPRRKRTEEMKLLNVSGLISSNASFLMIQPFNHPPFLLYQTFQILSSGEIFEVDKLVRLSGIGIITAILY